MENGFNSPRTDAFPAGLRVLVVDDDPTWLKILEKMLKKCSYEVTTCGLARDALSLLRERKDGYDIVISDVNMPDMDGFKLLEHVGLEMDLPVIMMSVDGETSRVMKGVQHGACDYLLKPIRMKELRNIWQHVFRKKIHEVRDIELIDGMDSIQMARIGYDFSDDGHLFYGEDTTSVKKRKDVESKNDDKDLGDSSSSKKARVVWSVDLHQKFVKAVNQIGFDKVGPKKILDLMNVPWLTRENVASHLQKYRLYLSRLQKDNESKISKHSESSLGTQIDISKGSYGFSSNNLFVQKAESRNFENERKGILPKSAAKPKRALDVDVPRSSPMEFSHPITSRRSEVNFPAFDLKSPTQFSWTGIPQVEVKQEHKPLHLDEGFNSNLVKTGQVSPMGPTINPDRVQTSHSGPKVNPSHVQVNHGQTSQVGPLGPAINPSHVQTKMNAPNHQSFDLISASSAVTKSQSQSQSFNSIDLDSAEKLLTWGTSAFPTLDDEMQFCLVQGGDCYAMNLGLQNIEIPEFYDPGINPFPEFQENLYDISDYALLEQGLFIA